MIENIENHIAYTCKCGGVNFALLKSGAIECNKCSQHLDGIEWGKQKLVDLLMPAQSNPENKTSKPSAIDMSRLPVMRQRDAYKMARELSDLLSTAPQPAQPVAQPQFGVSMYALPEYKAEQEAKNHKYSAMLDLAQPVVQPQFGVSMYAPIRLGMGPKND